MTPDRPTPRTETDESTTERDEVTHEDAETYRAPGTSRRSFLQTTAAAGLAGLGVGSGVVGSAAAAGIPTPWLEVNGNLLRDPEGNKVILRGVNVIDPARAAEEWRKNIEPLIELATDPGEGWHAHVVRLPMQPQDIGGHGPGTAAPTPGFSQSDLQTYLEAYVDPAVAAAADVGAYIMLDYHRHYPEGPDWDSPELDEEIRLFWNEVAPRYSDRSHVIYELYNEPNTPYPGAGDPTDDVGITDPRAEENYLYWRETAQPWVDLIREHALRNLIVIGSPRWSQFTYWAGKHEFEGDNLAYAGHVYAHENLRPLSTYFGDPSEEVPVFMSEFGYGTEGSPYLVGTNEVEGQQFLELFDAHDIHWQAWCFDHTWSPGMLNRDYEVDSPHGRLFKERLREKRNDDLPASAGGGDETPPSTPSNLAVTETSTNSVALAWDATTDSGGSGLENYAVYVDSALDHRVSAGPTTTAVGGLLPETTYEFAVSAIDGAGNESTPATVTVATTDGDDEQAPTMPENLSVTGSTSESISVSWDAATDEGGSGLDHYLVYFDGSQDQQVAAGTTEATVSGLDAATTYEIAVSAVDAAGNESATATVQATTATTEDGGEDPPEDALVDDYDGDPAWSNHRNDLGNWCGAGSFENGGGEVKDGALVLEYDNAGWFVEQILEDISAYSEIVFSIAGASGGEGEHFVVSVGGARGPFSDLASSSIGTSPSEVAIDLDSAGVDAENPGELRLNFWQAGSGSGTLRIEDIRLE
ncbi:chitinase protein [Halorhabdus tiamatea SARL4B]|nr:cellulase family glycosylhydrolase [Halorhabdus tiamatea]ERJ04713.1 chitinase protein [Halorhabdus tiamatea SARL4B]